MTQPAISLLLLYLALLAPCHAAEPGGHVDSTVPVQNVPDDHPVPPLPPLLHPLGLTQHLSTSTPSLASCDITVNDNAPTRPYGPTVGNVAACAPAASATTTVVDTTTAVDTTMPVWLGPQSLSTMGSTAVPDTSSAATTVDSATGAAATAGDTTTTVATASLTTTAVPGISSTTTTLDSATGAATTGGDTTTTVATASLTTTAVPGISSTTTTLDSATPQMRKRLFIVGFKNAVVDDVSMFFELAEFEHRTTLKKYLGKNFKKETAYTIRCGGKHSAIGDRHNWDGYWVDDKEYRPTIEDALKLQGFHNYKLTGTQKEQWVLLGNTIPIIFTRIIGKQILKHSPTLGKNACYGKPC